MIKTTLLTVLLFTLILPSWVFAYASGNRINSALSVFDTLHPVSGELETLTPSGFPPSTFETSRQGFDRNFSKTHPDLTPLEPRYLLGFELRFLGFCIRSGIIYTDPFGLFYFSGVQVEGNVLLSLVINRIQNKVADLLREPNFCQKLSILNETGWGDDTELARDFIYGTGPEIKFQLNILGETTDQRSFGLDDSALGTKIEAKLLDYRSYGISQKQMADVIADTVIHEMSHWKARTTNHSATDKQGWNFMTKIFGEQWAIPRKLPQDVGFQRGVDPRPYFETTPE